MCPFCAPIAFLLHADSTRSPAEGKKRKGEKEKRKEKPINSIATLTSRFHDLKRRIVLLEVEKEKEGGEGGGRRPKNYFGLSSTPPHDAAICDICPS